MAQYTVLVTGSGGQAALSIIKCLRLAGEKYRIITTDVDPLLAGPYVGDKGYLIEKGWNLFIPQLNKICANERVDIIIPGSDIEIDHLSSRREKLNTPIILADKKIVKISRDKLLLSQWLEKKGFPYPRTFKGLMDINPFPRFIPYPVIIKPRMGWGSNDQTRIKSEEEMRAYREFFREQGKLTEDSMITQELLDGTELSGMAIISKDGEILNISCAESVKKFGMSYKTIHGSEEDYLDFKSLVTKIVGKLGATGPLSIQGFKTSSGEIKIFEFNPRFTGAQIVRAHGGVNGPDILIENWLNGTKQYPTVKERFVALWYADYLYIPYNDYENLKTKKEIEKKGVGYYLL